LSATNEWPVLAVQRPSSLKAGGLIVDGRSSTRSGHPTLKFGSAARRYGCSV